MPDIESDRVHRLAVGGGGGAGNRHAVLRWTHGFAPRLPTTEFEPRGLRDIEAAFVADASRR
jgi:hypothetical protein